MDGKKKLNAGRDYTVTYENNEQENVTKYVNNEADASVPVAIISLTENSNYNLLDENANTVNELKIPLKICKKILKKNELYVVVDEPVYNGKQLMPCGDAVKVYIGDKQSVKSAIKSGERDEKLLTSKTGSYKLTRLTEVQDYVISGYGTNVMAGKNKGTLTITGNSKEYGGSVIVKFTIQSKIIEK